MFITQAAQISDLLRSGQVVEIGSPGRRSSSACLVKGLVTDPSRRWFALFRSRLRAYGQRFLRATDVVGVYGGRAAVYARNGNKAGICGKTYRKTTGR